MRSNESIVHFVPPDDECSINNKDSIAVLVPKPDAFFLRSAALCDNENDDMLLMIDQTLHGLRDSRQTTLSSASHVLVKEVERVNKRLAIYCNDYSYKRQKGGDASPEKIDLSRARCSISETQSHRSSCQGFSTIENSQKVQPAQSLLETKLKRTNTLRVDGSIVRYGDTFDRHKVESNVREENNDESEIEKQDYIEAASLMKQAHRVKRMALLLRSIDAKQRLLFKELSECRVAVTKEQQEKDLPQHRSV